MTSPYKDVDTNVCVRVCVHGRTRDVCDTFIQRTFPIFAGGGCGGQLDASDAGYITSPGYPLEYPAHQNCLWVITAPEPSQRIVLNFNPHFELEKLDCR